MRLALNQALRFSVSYRLSADATVEVTNTVIDEFVWPAGGKRVGSFDPRTGRVSLLAPARDWITEVCASEPAQAAIERTKRFLAYAPRWSQIVLGPGAGPNRATLYEGHYHVVVRYAQCQAQICGGTVFLTNQGRLDYDSNLLDTGVLTIIANRSGYPEMPEPPDLADPDLPRIRRWFEEICLADRPALEDLFATTNPEEISGVDL